MFSLARRRPVTVRSTVQQCAGRVALRMTAASGIMGMFWFVNSGISLTPTF